MICGTHDRAVFDCLTARRCLAASLMIVVQHFNGEHHYNSSVFNWNCKLVPLELHILFEDEENCSQKRE
jgi:hypothetical protein